MLKNGIIRFSDNISKWLQTQNIRKNIKYFLILPLAATYYTKKGPIYP